jgi:cold shock CspA family protein
LKEQCGGSRTVAMFCGEEIQEATDMSDLQYGILITWFRNRRFGFIRTENSDTEIFVHASDFLPNREPFPKGTRVKFEVGLFGGRPKAIKVEAIQ